MNPQTPKYAIVVMPTAIYDDAAATTVAVDTKDYDFARVGMMIGVTDIAMAVLTLQQSAESGANYTDITGANFAAGGTDIEGSTLALPSSTADNTFIVVEVDLRGKKRYLDLSATAGNGSAGTYFAAWCELYKGVQAPYDNTTANATVVRV